jgi:PAS domain-containing protein
VAGLARGTYARLWLLLALTFAFGLVSLWAFGRTETLWISCGVLVLLLYKMLGREMNRRREREQLAPLVERGLASIDAEIWLALDATGIVLAISDAGSHALGWPADEIVGRQLADLVSTAASRAHVAELLRFSKLGRDWSGELDLAEQSGVPRRHVVRVLEWGDQIAREAGLIAVGPRSSPDVSVLRATEPEA